jgi:hypothetical protein
MQRLGSKSAHLLDAFSSSYWGLTKLFRNSGFRYRSAVGFRVHADAALSNGIAIWALGKIPVAMFDAFAPLSPSFVFVLEKPSEASVAAVTKDSGAS